MGQTSNLQRQPIFHHHMLAFWYLLLVLGSIRVMSHEHLGTSFHWSFHYLLQIYPSWQKKDPSKLIITGHLFWESAGNSGFSLQRPINEFFWRTEILNVHYIVAYHLAIICFLHIYVVIIIHLWFRWLSKGKILSLPYLSCVHIAGILLL